MFVAATACGGNEANDSAGDLSGDPGASGTWVMDYVQYDNRHCTGTMTLGVSGAQFSGTLSMDPCLSGSVTAVTLGWDGTSGQFSGSLAATDGWTRVIYDGVYDRHALVFKLGNTTNPGNYVGRYTGSR
jgi:hypothetical protein